MATKAKMRNYRPQLGAGFFIWFSDACVRALALRGRFHIRQVYEASQEGWISGSSPGVFWHRFFAIDCLPITGC